jgi:hypothetical protein
MVSKKKKKKKKVSIVDGGDGFGAASQSIQLSRIL